MTTLGSDSYVPPRPPEPFKGDKEAVEMLRRLRDRLQPYQHQDERLADKVTRLGQLVRDLTVRDDQYLTVLDRKRQLQRGVPAASYTPSSGSAPRVCEHCDGTGWSVWAHRHRCPDPACETAARRTEERAESATQDLRQLEQDLERVKHVGEVIVYALRHGDGYSGDAGLAKPLGRIERSLAATPPAERGSPFLEHVLERENVRAAPDCPSCLRVGFACAVRQTRNDRGYLVNRSLCAWCEKWAGTEESEEIDQDGKPLRVPLLYLTAQHADPSVERVKVLDANHVDRKRWEAKAKKGRNVGGSAA